MFLCCLLLIRLQEEDMALESNHMSEGACYRHHSGRDMAAISILRVAHKLFSQATIIQHLNNVEDVVINRGFDIREFHNLVKTFDPPFLDAFRIATSFENFFKAELILFGYVIHKINRNSRYSSLRSQQQYRPIKVSEIRSLERGTWKRRGLFQINSLSKTTLTLAELISKTGRYKNSLRLSNFCIDTIDTIRKQRNTVHFLVNDIGHYNKKVVESYIYLRSFMNERLIPRYNSVIMRWDHLKNDPELRLNEI